MRRRKSSFTSSTVGQRTCKFASEPTKCSGILMPFAIIHGAFLT